MALLLRADGTSKTYADAQLAVAEFMRVYCVEWLGLEGRPVEEGESPWNHPKLVRAPVEECQPHWNHPRLEEGDGCRPDTEHYDRSYWTYYTLAMISDFGRRDGLPENPWCPPLLGPILLYTSCVCDYDGAQYKCDFELREDVCIELLRLWCYRARNIDVRIVL